jgi:hypothetical protein
MGLIEWILTGTAAIILRALSTLIADDARAWIPKVTERIILYAVGKLPENLRGTYSDEWQSYIFDTPGELCKLRAACGFVFASWRMARDLRETAAPAIRIQRSLLQLDQLQAALEAGDTSARQLLETCQIVRSAATQWPDTVKMQAEETKYFQQIRRFEILGHEGLESLGRDFAMCFALTQGLNAITHQFETSTSCLTLIRVRAKLWIIDRTFLSKIRASAAEKRERTAVFRLAADEHKEACARLLRWIAEPGNRASIVGTT